MSLLELAAAAVRGVHLAVCLGLFGAASALLFAGPTDRPTALAWQARTHGWARAFALTALGSGLATLALQTAVLEERPTAALEPDALLRVLQDTQAGLVWVVRHALLVVVTAFLLMRADLGRRVDWRAARVEVALLGGAVLGIAAAAGHAAAVEPDARIAVAADAGHLLAAGGWGGALLPLALLVRAAATPAGADARPYAVLALRRFSTAAQLLVAALVVTGLLGALIEVGSVAGLVGTRHGLLLASKITVFALLLIPAARSRRAVPALSGPGDTVGRPAMRRLARAMGWETAGVAVILVVTAAIIATPPARHASPTWPFDFRLTLAALQETPALRPLVLVGTQLAVLGVATLLAAVTLRRWRRPLLAGGAVVVIAGSAIAVPPLAIDAYPTTFQRPGVPYTASSVAAGSTLYREHCAVCHGAEGRGDGPGARGLPRPPADLRAAHTAAHTAGDLFWWIGHGRPGMPGFTDRLPEDARWDLVNFIRALAAADATRTLGAAVEPERARVAAPDFTFAVGPTPSRTLRDYRGRRHVLLVVYTLPGSAPRMIELARRQDVLAAARVEVVAVPRQDAASAVARLGALGPVYFPVATEGAEEIARTYGLFAGPPHAEFLIDRAGYLRAIERGPGSVDAVVANVQVLDREPAPPPPAEHVH